MTVVLVSIYVNKGNDSGQRAKFCMQLLYRESLITTRGVTEKIVVGGVGSVDLDWADSLMDVQNA